MLLLQLIRRLPQVVVVQADQDDVQPLLGELDEEEVRFIKKLIKKEKR